MLFVLGRFFFIFYSPVQRINITYSLCRSLWQFWEVIQAILFFISKIYWRITRKDHLGFLISWYLKLVDCEVKENICTNLLLNTCKKN